MDNTRTVIMNPSQLAIIKAIMKERELAVMREKEMMNFILAGEGIDPSNVVGADIQEAGIVFTLKDVNVID